MAKTNPYEPPEDDRKTETVIFHPDQIAFGFCIGMLVAMGVMKLSEIWQ